MPMRNANINCNRKEFRNDWNCRVNCRGVPGIVLSMSVGGVDESQWD